MKKLIALSLLLGSAVANAVEINLTALDSLSLTGDSIAYGMNDSGQIVGNSYNSETDRVEAVIWNNGVVQTLGVEGVARDVNNSGTVVGETGTFAATTNVYGYGRAFKWDGLSGYSDLGTLGGANAGAWSVNDSGVIAGSSLTHENAGALTQSHGFRWVDDTMMDLGTVSSPTGYSRANAINESGDIVGRASVIDFGGSNKYMTYWDSADNITQVTGPYDYSNGLDINNSGIIVGNAKNAAGNQTAAVWDENGVSLLGSLGGDRSYLRALNDAGVMVGRSELAVGSTASHAIISYDGINIIDLNTLVSLGGTGFSSLDEAWDINAAGEIVGFGTRTDGSKGAFVLSAVPIPAAVWLFGSALGILGWIRRRKADIPPSLPTV